MATLANTTTDKVKSAVNNLDPQMMEQVSHLKDEAIEAYKNSEKYVRQNPFYFIGGAAILGLVTGLLISRRD